MKRLLAIAGFLTLLSGTVLADELKRFSLDDAGSLGTTIQTDAGVKTEGSGSVRVTTRYPTTVCIEEVAGLDVENSRVLFRAKVRSDLEGSAYLEMWAQLGGRQFFSKGVHDRIKGRSNWRLLQTPFIFQKGQRPDRLILNLVIEGKGSVWIDDVALMKEPLK